VVVDLSPGPFPMSVRAVQRCASRGSPQAGRACPSGATSGRAQGARTGGVSGWRGGRSLLRRMPLSSLGLTLPRGVELRA